MTSEKIVSLFPGIEKIHNEDIKQKTVNAIKVAAEIGGWNDETLESCPMTMNWSGSDVKLLEHINTTVDVCLSSYKVMEELLLRHNADFSYDVMLSGALLHDIGKFCECMCVDGVPTKGDTKIMRHPLLGAIIASKADLPDRIVNLIAVHGFEGDNSFMTPEAEFVKRCDILAFYTALYGVKK